MPMLIAVIGWACSAQLVLAVDCSVPLSSTDVSLGNTFNVSVAGFTSSDIQSAAAYWTCPGYSGEIPTFQVGAGDVSVSVIKMVGNSTTSEGGCGLYVPDIINGHLESATIRVWTNQADGTSCSPLTDVIAHEFGHLLGLTDVLDSTCNGHIMGVRVLSTREVYSDDCEVADNKWETPFESAQPQDPYCDAYCWTSCSGGSCPSGNPWCPILVDLENDGIHLTGAVDPVWFDIDADGDADLVSWTDRSEGILALDRNGNGMIDNGGELFGNATRLATGARAANGYAALAELDSWALGGNGDGLITSADASFDSLRLWKDLNHDGVSQADELQALPEAGIQRLDLDYKLSHRTDRFGNEFRYLGRAWRESRNGVAHPVVTWDVFFVVVH